MNSRCQFLLVFSLLTANLHAEVRTFTSSAGTTIRGEIVSISDGKATIKKQDGTVITVPVIGFSRVDQAWIQANGSPGAASSPASATKDAPFINSLGMKFVPVSGTSVLFCATLTRMQDYMAYAAATGAKPVAKEWEKQKEDKEHHPFPVLINWGESLSWDESKGFCDWLSKKEGRAYRLPTDREWSVAVGIGSRETQKGTPEDLNGRLTDVYPWGSQWPPPNGFANYADKSFRDYCKKIHYQPLPPVIDGYKDGELGVSPVESFRPNRLGLYDMSGNLWQWCEDWFDAAKTKRFGRGGCWGSSTKEMLLSSARWADMTDLKGNISFRCVLELPAP